MVSENNNTKTSSLFKKFKRGDIRSDGYRFWQYHNRKKISGDYYMRECWLSPEKYNDTIEKKRIHNRNRMRVLRKNPDFVLKEKEKDKNPEIKKKKLERLRKWQNNKRATDPIFMLKKDISSRIRESFKYKNCRKNSKTSKILGCSYKFFASYIEARFAEGMSWNNRSEWHIDHIVPLASAKTKSDLIKLNHFSNLRPLWARDNIIKSDKPLAEQLELI
jgi:hypothetical protein